MNILLIEDDDFKRDNIVSVIANSYDARFDISSSVNGGLSCLSKKVFDVVLLDMSLPTFDVGPNERGGRPQGFGGREVLRQMDRFGIVTPVIVITQYAKFDSTNEVMSLEELSEVLYEEHRDILKSIIYYSSSSDDWKGSLIKVLGEI